MDVTITINTGNAAFEDNPGGEVARILRVVALYVDGGLGALEAPITDKNGNRVGVLKVTPDLVETPPTPATAAAFAGKTEAQLSALFDLVKRKKNWKGPINKVVRHAALAALHATPGDVCDAIVFYTGGNADYMDTPTGYRIYGAGYYASVGS